jgi:hypothetical protein
MSRVTLRKVPAALALGLLASLVAHVKLYGGEHAVGGAYHALLMDMALAAALGFAALAAALAWSQLGSTTDGSVIAGRLRERLPSVSVVFVAAAASYLVVEAIEPHHAGAPGLALLAALAVASYAAVLLAHALTGALARVVIEIARTSFSPRAPVWRRRPRGQAIAHRWFLARRRFARPPPIEFALPRA